MSRFPGSKAFREEIEAGIKEKDDRRVIIPIHNNQERFLFLDTRAVLFTRE
jgi:hypothetical protein